MTNDIKGEKVTITILDEDELFNEENHCDHYETENNHCIDCGYIINWVDKKFNIWE